MLCRTASSVRSSAAVCAAFFMWPLQLHLSPEVNAHLASMNVSLPLRGRSRCSGSIGTSVSSNDTMSARCDPCWQVSTLTCLVIPQVIPLRSGAKRSCAAGSASSFRCSTLFRDTSSSPSAQAGTPFILLPLAQPSASANLFVSCA